MRDLGRVRERTAELTEANERLRTHRHDIANQLNQVLGFCQLLLIQQHDYFGRLTEDLELIQTKCKACVATLQRYKTVDLDQAPGLDWFIESVPVASDANELWIEPRGPADSFAFDKMKESADSVMYGDRTPREAQQWLADQVSAEVARKMES